MKQYRWGFLGLVIGVISLAIYSGTLPDSPDVEVMGEDKGGTTLQDWLAFSGMVLGFGAALLNLIKSFIDMCAARRDG